VKWGLVVASVAALGIIGLLIDAPGMFISAGLAVPLSALSAESVSRLQAELRLVAIARAQVIGQVGGAHAAIAWAIWTNSATAIIVQSVVGAGVSSWLLLRTAKSASELGRQLDGGKRYIHLIGTSTVTFLNRRGDDVLVATLVGASELAVYSGGYRVFSAITELVYYAADAVMLPVLRRASLFGNSRSFLSAPPLSWPRSRRHFQRGLVCGELVGLYGAGWSISGSVLALLVVGGVTQSFRGSQVRVWFLRHTTAWFRYNVVYPVSAS
jgi:hypothetical protein